MAETEAQAGDRSLLFGPGPRAREVAAVVATLASLPVEDGAEAARAVVPALLEDLEGLLRERPGEGVLILESSRVPGEDIGFVRRFLERHPRWSLVTLCDDLQDARARDLSGLPQARALVWPPDLESLRALLAPERREGRRARRGAPDGSGPAARPERVPVKNGALDLGLLLEEILASAALRGEGSPRYQFRCDVPVLVDREREPLVEGLSGLLELARLCAGPDGLVRAGVIPGAEGARIGLEFPLGELPEKDLARFLEGPIPSDGDEALAQGVRAAKHGADLLRGLGGHVEFGPSDGRVRCEVRLARPRGAPRPPSARAGKPEDPFA